MPDIKPANRSQGRGVHNARRRGTLVDLILLTLLSLGVYFTGLTSHGLTNWQESQRALVVREMTDPANPFNPGGINWLVPTINFNPYLAKPPLFYWVQIVLAGGGTPGEFELRLGVAIAGLLGVLLTYVVARRLFGSMQDPPASGLSPPRLIRGDWARTAALCSAACLATGMLYVRSSRIGELDIWQVPFVVAGVGAIFHAWLTWRERARVSYVAVLVAASAASLAALTKGPPAVMVVAIAGFGAIALWAALSHEVDSATMKNRRRLLAIVLSLAAAGLATFNVVPTDTVPRDVVLRVRGLGDIVGVIALATMAGQIGWVFAGLMSPVRHMAMWRVFARTHPIGVLALPALALWGWGRLAAARIGPEVAASWAQKEAEDNLNILVPIAPLKNLEAASFGVGLGSVLAIAAVVWFVRVRPRLTPGVCLLIAWAGLGFAAYSTLGKGVGRYLTPIWPGIAMLGGMLIATLWHEHRAPRLLRPLFIGTIIALAAGQGWWYGVGRELFDPQRSPRAMIQELLAPPHDVESSRIASFEFWSAAPSIYAGAFVHPVGDIFIRDKTAGESRETLVEFIARLARTGETWTLLVRNSQPNDPYWSPVPALDRLKAAGLAVEPIPLKARFAIDNAKTDVLAIRVRVP